MSLVSKRTQCQGKYVGPDANTSVLGRNAGRDITDILCLWERLIVRKGVGGGHLVSHYVGVWIHVLLCIKVEMDPVLDFVYMSMSAMNDAASASC